MNKSLVVYYSVFGSTKNVAELIAETIHADISEIELVKPYSKLAAYTKGAIDSMQGRQKLPEIKNTISIEDYDIIYIGAPIWNYTLNIALQSWLKNVDVTNKIVIPFCTNDGDPGDWYEKITELCTNALEIKQGISITGARRKNIDQLQKEVISQLNQI